MKVLVAYMSSTGNTKKIAEAIFEEIEEEKEIRKIEQVESIGSYDVAFLGFPVHNLGPDKKAVKLLKRHCTDGRAVVLFITHGTRENSPDLLPQLDKFRQAASGANIVDVFNCQGELAKAIKRVMSIWPNAQFRLWAKMDNSQGQPDTTRIDRARAFSRAVMERFHSAPMPAGASK